MPETTPYWWVDAGAPTSPPEVPLPSEADVVVVGAGLTGMSAARTLARSGRSVVALDASAPGVRASSCNGGMIGGGHQLDIDEIREKFGSGMVEPLLRETHLDANAFIKALISDEQIDCDLAVTGRFRGLWSTREYDAAGRELDRLKAIVPVEAEMVPRERQHVEVATDIYSGGTVLPLHGGLNPAKYVAGVMEAAIRWGAVVQGDTPVTGVTRSRSAFSVQTSRGSVRAGSVLVATNGYTPAALGFARRRIVPVPSFLVATEPLGVDTVKSLFPNGRMVAESRNRHCYYRPSPDGQRLVFGGRAAMTPVPERFATSQLRRLIGSIFPQLGDIAFSHSWNARTGFAFDFTPHVGCYDGVWYAMGYSGSGNSMAPYLGHKAALQVLGDPEGETVFTRSGFPTRWWHRGTPWFLPFADMLFRMKDAANNVRLDRRRPG
ncbi:MAG: Gamma-glutamylputrescine oxidoreductase [Acidimicrobiaceae bacterium]|nr:Gamma-glutamylputrescine oxidoreductase [Acidimicrobiaceae bacterium]